MAEGLKTDWPPRLPPGTLVWCSNCDARRPYAIEDNDADSVDLLCKRCKYVIATFHRAQES